METTGFLRAAHDVSLAAWFGGSWMGAVGLNAATIEVDDHTQRTRVANAGWFHWAPIAGTVSVAHVLSAVALGRAGPRSRGTLADPLRDVRTAVTASALLATLWTGVSGRRVARAGDVPVATAVRPIEATPDDVATAQRHLRVAQWLVPVLTGALWIVNAVQGTRSRSLGPSSRRIGIGGFRGQRARRSVVDTR